MITIIGGANVDISAQLLASEVVFDSTPARISVSLGGVARNVAHDLAVLGCSVRFVTLLGHDAFADMIERNCFDMGIDLSLSGRANSVGTGTYLCINNSAGDMEHAAADTAIIDGITPSFLGARIESINQSDVVVADCNLSAESLCYLIDNVTVPLFFDGVSTHKARRAVDALLSSKKHKVSAVKLNGHEALAVTGAPSVAQAAEALHEMGVENVYITLGGDGVLLYNGTAETLPATAVEVVNTTGAGDAFLAGVVFAFVSGKTLREAAVCGLEAARQTLLVNAAVNPDLKL